MPCVLAIKIGDRGPRHNGDWDDQNIVRAYEAEVRNGQVWFKPGGWNPRKIPGMDVQGWESLELWQAENAAAPPGKRNFFREYDIRFLPNRNHADFADKVGRGRGELIGAARSTGERLAALRDKRQVVPVQLADIDPARDVVKGPEWGKVEAVGEV